MDSTRHIATLEEFAEWAKTQIGNEFNYNNECNCPMANFAKEKFGFTSPHATTDIVYNLTEDGATSIVVFRDKHGCHVGSVFYEFIRGCTSFEKMIERLEK